MIIDVIVCSQADYLLTVWDLLEGCPLTRVHPCLFEEGVSWVFIQTDAIIADSIRLHAHADELNRFGCVNFYLLQFVILSLDGLILRRFYSGSKHKLNDG